MDLEYVIQTISVTTDKQKKNLSWNAAKRETREIRKERKYELIALSKHFV